jgi:hypothetical protein
MICFTKDKIRMAFIHINVNFLGQLMEKEGCANLINLYDVKTRIYAYDLFISLLYIQHREIGRSFLM